MSKSSSYIAFELDALNKAPQVATLAGIGAEWVTHGLVQMWAYCFRSKVDVVSAMQLKAFFGVDAGVALEAFDFLEAVESGWRVRGADRYLRLAKTRQAAGKAGREAQLKAASEAVARADASKTRAKPPNDPVLPEQKTASVGQTVEVEPESDTLPGQKRALSPSTEASSSKKQSSQQPGARAHYEPVAETVDPPPDPRVAAAMKRWHARLAALVPHGAVDDASVLSVAADFSAEIFAAGVERHVDEGPAYWCKTPIRFLRLRCEWARDDAAKRAAAPPPEAHRSSYGGRSRAIRGEAY